MKLKISLLVLFSLILFLPAIHRDIHIFRVRHLNGSFASVEKPTFNFTGWMQGSFQDSIEPYLKDNIGMGNFLIRINNQLDFSLFNESNTKNTIIGKSGYLFEESYIFAHRGDDFKGQNLLANRIEKLKFVQDRLKDLGIQFVFVIAPGKASFYEEYIPDCYNIVATDSTNYKVVANELIRNNVNHIDFSKYFLEIKEKSDHTLMPKNGIHWSYYGVSLVMDSIANYIEKSCNVDLVDFRSEEGSFAYNRKDTRGTDSDIGDALNLLYEPRNSVLYYPDVVFNYSDKTVKPNLLSIGDSFNNSFFNTYPYFEELFSDSTRFWYYNQTVNYPAHIAAKYISVKSLNLKNEMKDRDIVMIVATEQNLDNPGFGYQDLIYPYLLNESNK